MFEHLSATHMPGCLKLTWTYKRVKPSPQWCGGKTKSSGIKELNANPTFASE